MDTNILEWIQNWYKTECNEDWEHTYGIRIETVDNPGWFLQIDLKETDYVDIVADTGLIEYGEHDWYIIKIEDSVYKASGDPSKLEFLLTKFREIIESSSQSN